jgi:hypothetical protein
MLNTRVQKVLVLATATASLWSCTPYNAIKATDESSKSSNSTLGADGACSVSQEEGGALISCPDGSMAFVPNGTNGTNGTDGKNGVDGKDGADGSSCSVQDLGDKAILACEDGTMVVIEDGKDGSGVTTSPLVNIINACGEQGSELLLQFANGDIYGSVMIEQRYIAIVAPGMTENHNETKCEFSVTPVNR